MSERVIMMTDDGVEIVGTFVAPVHATHAVLCLHMMPADRASWHAVQTMLAEHGIASLAIDLRGHGESVRMAERRLDYLLFGEIEHQESRLDLLAASAWLRTCGFSTDRLGVIGASIGANLALQFAGEESRIPAVALLSPGENYRGIFTLPAAARLRDPQALLVVASSDDEASCVASRELVEQARIADKTLLLLENAGHGTRMFDAKGDLLTNVVDWFVERLK